YPLYAIQTDSPLKQQLLDHIIIFENYPFDPEALSERKLGFRIASMEVREQTNYGLNVVVAPGAVMTVRFSFNALLYDAAFLRTIEEQFKQVLRVVDEDADIRADEVDIVGAEQKRKLLGAFNNTQAAYPCEQTIHGLFEEQAERTPNKTAV